jgi:glucose/mannose-6-phosphate isomerase
MSKRNIAKRIAKEICKKLVFVYAPNLHFDVVALRFRGQIAENSKALASSHVLPEMNHNEIVGWVNPQELFKDFAVIFLRDSREHPQVTKRMQITADIIDKEGAKIIQIYSRGKGLLARIFSLIYIGDFTSFYLALLYEIDPTPVERINYLKKRLAS